MEKLYCELWWDTKMKMLTKLENNRPILYSRRRKRKQST